MYTYRFGHRYTHQRPESLSDLKKYEWLWSLGLFYNKVGVGYGQLEIKDLSKRWVHTDGVELFDKFRNKGHGIYLYWALFTAAKKLGAVRVYSSVNLNKHSRRMWSLKLKRDLGLDVHTVTRCKNACAHCEKTPIYYIDL